MNRGIEEMKRILKDELRRLKTLKNEKTKLETQYTNTRTSDSQRERITLRLRTFLLPAIRTLERQVQSQIRQTKGIESGVEKLKTARNKMNRLKAQLQHPRGMGAAAASSASSASSSTSTRRNHLTPTERKNLQNFETNLLREFGPITEQNIMNEARRMKAEENSALERIMRNYKNAKTQEQREYYSKMMNAILNESTLRPMTPEEETEVNTYLAQLKGGDTRQDLRRRLTRRRR
jgi:hypothetical protein